MKNCTVSYRNTTRLLKMSSTPNKSTKTLHNRKYIQADTAKNAVTLPYCQPHAQGPNSKINCCSHGHHWSCFIALYPDDLSSLKFTLPSILLTVEIPMHLQFCSSQQPLLYEISSAVECTYSVLKLTKLRKRSLRSCLWQIKLMLHWMANLSYP